MKRWQLAVALALLLGLVSVGLVSAHGPIIGSWMHYGYTTKIYLRNQDPFTLDYWAEAGTYMWLTRDTCWNTWWGTRCLTTFSKYILLAPGGRVELASP